MMPPLLARRSISPPMFLRKHPLPEKLLRGVWILPLEGIGQNDAAPTIRQITFVESPDGFQMLLQRNVK